MFLNELINNKKVVIVGPAGYLNGLGMGELIDSYDIVIKINGLLFNQTPQDHGRRIDILVTNGEFIRRNKLTDEILINHQVKFLLCKELFNNNTKIPYEYIRRVKDILFLKNEPLNGSNAINQILDNNPKELFIIGFDFYLGENTYVKNYRTENPENINLKIDWDFTFNENNQLHNISQDFKFLVKLLATNNNIKLDSELKKYINIYNELKNEH